MAHKRWTTIATKLQLGEKDGMSFGLAHGPTDLLFCSTTYSEVEARQEEACKNYLAKYNPDQLLNSGNEALLGHFRDKFEFRIPALQPNAITVEQKEVQVDVRGNFSYHVRDTSRPAYVAGTAIVVEVPFIGDEAFFRVQPPNFTLSPPRARVRGNVVVFRIEGIKLDSNQVQNKIQDQVAEISRQLDSLRAAADGFNQRLAAKLPQQIHNRKEKLLSDQKLVANLGFAIKRRDDAKTIEIPLHRKTIRTLPTDTTNTTSSSPEYRLSEPDYQSILKTMSNMTMVMERSPSVFETIDEEAIRTHFLVQLNGQYEGKATGETFNHNGKTDILLRENGKNVFIAECKFWHGEKAFLEAIDQLLGYLSWRDTKCAILLFNRNKDFSGVLAQLKPLTESHSGFRRFVRQTSETSWEFRFSHKDDMSRELTITVMAFNIPRPTTTSGPAK